MRSVVPGRPLLCEMDLAKEKIWGHILGVLNQENRRRFSVCFLKLALSLEAKQHYREEGQ